MSTRVKILSAKWSNPLVKQDCGTCVAGFLNRLYAAATGILIGGFGENIAPIGSITFDGLSLPDSKRRADERSVIRRMKSFSYRQKMT